MGAPKGLVLFPGAGSNRDHSSLVSLEDRLAPMPVGRFDFPYRRAGRKAPDRAPVLLDCVTEEVRNFARDRRVRTSSLVIGGRSMGGRMCSMVAAGVDGREPLKVKGLVLVSYPLHPPAKPGNLRVEHLPRIDVPVLFVHGTKDPFGSPDELREHATSIPGPVTFHFVENGRHDLARKDAEIAEAVIAWMSGLRRPAG
jgi:predicted alpha/beta-hydrolase family hydrolase